MENLAQGKTYTGNSFFRRIINTFPTHVPIPFPYLTSISGIEAKKVKLIDEIGGYIDALRIAQQLGKIEILGRDGDIFFHFSESSLFLLSWICSFSSLHSFFVFTLLFLASDVNHW